MQKAHTTAWINSSLRLIPYTRVEIFSPCIPPLVCCLFLAFRYSLSYSTMTSPSYKCYQQVLNLNVPKEKAVVPPKISTKRRTKSGCLTCRKRKKKCDEDVSDGKCRGCTRNFLECCWPSKEIEACSTALPLTPSSSMDDVTKAVTPPKTPVLTTAYPSPELSPVLESESGTPEVLMLVLPKSLFKIIKPRLEVKTAKFVNTSVQRRKLVHISWKGILYYIGMYGKYELSDIQVNTWDLRFTDCTVESLVSESTFAMTFVSPRWILWLKFSSCCNLICG